MITYHHIGGRNGTYPLPLKSGPLLNDFHLILYDADMNCFEQMQEAGHDAWGKVSVYPYCIGGKTETSRLNLNFHPTTNSLYSFNDAYKDYNYISNSQYGEYVFGDACKHMRFIDLKLLSLEDALQTAKLISLDFLSLDVQGAEYDILSGANSLLQKECIGVQLEVEFVKLYQDQKTFSEINALMDELGFELLDLGSFGRCAPISLPIGFRGLEQPLYAEAVYIKKIDELIKQENIILLYKAALYTLMYKKLGLCFKFLNRISQLTDLNKKNNSNPLYMNCLNEIWALFNDAQHIKLPKLSQLFSHERFQNYYGLKTFDETIADHSVVESMRKLLSSVQQVNQYTNSPLEKLLHHYGLVDVADIVKQNRLFESQCFLELHARL